MIILLRLKHRHKETEIFCNLPFRSYKSKKFTHLNFADESFNTYFAFCFQSFYSPSITTKIIRDCYLSRSSRIHGEEKLQSTINISYLLCSRRILQLLKQRFSWKNYSKDPQSNLKTMRFLVTEFQ